MNGVAAADAINSLSARETFSGMTDWAAVAWRQSVIKGWEGKQGYDRADQLSSH